MEWLQQNGLSVFLTLMFVGLALKNPILARVYGVKSITVHELAALLKAKPSPLLLDVRTSGEFDSGHIVGARNEPLSGLGGRVGALREFAGDRDVVVVCRSGARSLSGSVVLKRGGCPKVYNVSGGMLQWVAQGYPASR
ncbi:MAG: rhodanese-like domain-containing protein [Magnetococcales bacterium]|nr:rhodanese-like domain-containing protein [Magnetococcales bacterium]